MANQAGKVYASADELIAGVAKETGVSPDNVRKVIRASFASTKDFILRELAEAQTAQGGKTALSDQDLDQVAGGVILQNPPPGLSLFRKSFAVNPDLLGKIGALGP
jgi:hypothetical protein